MNSIVWVVINCSSKKEAAHIGRELLRARLIACFDVIPERQSSYFWPPRTGRIESIKGSMLIGVTLPSYYKKILTTTRKLHSDEVPFVGSTKIDPVNPDYYRWLKSELKQKLN